MKTMEILLYEMTYERVKCELDENAPAVVPVVMHDDGGLSRKGKKIKPEDANPEAAFACSDLYNRGPARDFMIFLLKSDSVRWVQSGAAGFDNPVFGMLADKGIRLTKSNAAAVAISEFVLASVLHFLHPFQKRRESQGKRVWERHEFHELSAKKWLIIGLGHIGREIALRASAFGCPVIGVRRRPVENEPTADVITPDRTGEFLPDADVIVLSAALNTTTDHLVDRSFLQALKSSSILVNIARGPIIDEKALLESLDHGKPRFAILDVFETEPLPEDSPLWLHPRVQVTAHSSAFTPEKQIRGDRVFLENLKLYRAGKALHFEVSKSEFKTD